jgi:hypothetical protein
MLSVLDPVLLNVVKNCLDAFAGVIGLQRIWDDRHLVIACDRFRLLLAHTPQDDDRFRAQTPSGRRTDDRAPSAWPITFYEKITARRFRSTLEQHRTGRFGHHAVRSAAFCLVQSGSTRGNLNFPQQATGARRAPSGLVAVCRCQSESASSEKHSENCCDAACFAAVSRWTARLT